MSCSDRQAYTLEDAAVSAQSHAPDLNLCALTGQEKHSPAQMTTGIAARDMPNLSIANTPASAGKLADSPNLTGASGSLAGFPFASNSIDASPANAADPFSATDISNAGQQLADELRAGSSDPNDLISYIRSQDKSQSALNQDIADYAKSGAVGGIQTLVLNDCWFESPLAALANAPGGAEKISQMITTSSDGGYTVTFPGAKDKPVTISKDEVDKNGQVTNTAEWGKVIEAAILKADPSECDANGPGGFAMNAIHLLTGENAGYAFTFDSNASNLASLISSSLQEGKPVVVDSDQVAQPANGAAPPADAPAPVQAPIIDGHTYAVIDCDKNSDTITLRNPWGTNDVPPGTQENGVTVEGAGEISMSMDTFMKNFRQVSYAP
jgi:hypothetical protein